MARSVSNGFGGRKIHRYSGSTDVKRVVKGKGNPSLEIVLLGLFSVGVGFLLLLVLLGG